MFEAQLYLEGLSCMEKISRSLHHLPIDSDAMLKDYQRSIQIIDDLRDTENNKFYSESLNHLLYMLTHQQKCLVASIQKRNKLDTPRGQVQVVNAEDKHSRERRSVIDSTVYRSSSRQVRFSDIAGLEDAKQLLKEAIEIPAQFPHLFSGNLRPWSSVLLYGPPGTGKTRLAQATASEFDAVFYSVSSSDLISSYVGESEKIIRELFHHARKHKRKSIIFIDEIDSLCRQRMAKEEEHSRRVKTELLVQMEGLEGDDVGEMFLLCSTNRPWELDTAFIRRFQRRVYVPLPDRTARKHILQLHCSGQTINMEDDDWWMIVNQTENYSGSDLALLTRAALFRPIKELMSCRYWAYTDDLMLTPCSSDVIGCMQACISDLPQGMVKPRPTDLEDFHKALSSTTKTVDQSLVKQFEGFIDSSST